MFYDIKKNAQSWRKTSIKMCKKCVGKFWETLFSRCWPVAEHCLFDLLFESQAGHLILNLTDICVWKPSFFVILPGFPRDPAKVRSVHTGTKSDLFWSKNYPKRRIWKRSVWRVLATLWNSSTHLVSKSFVCYTLFNFSLSRRRSLSFCCAAYFQEKTRYF